MIAEHNEKRRWDEKREFGSARTLSDGEVGTGQEAGNWGNANRPYREFKLMKEGPGDRDQIQMAGRRHSPDRDS